MTTQYIAAGCPLALPECPCSTARPPALRMERLKGDLFAIATALRRADQRVFADEIMRLVDRLNGLAAPTDAKRNHRLTIRGRQIEVQQVRGSFGL